MDSGYSVSSNDLNCVPTLFNKTLFGIHNRFYFGNSGGF